MPKEKILVIGANGQLGSVLTRALRRHYGSTQVVASDICHPQQPDEGPFEWVSVMDAKRLSAVVEKHQINQIYHLAAILSAKGEQDPVTTWDINMTGLLNVLEVARHHHMTKVYFPSSIAIFGDKTPRQHTPQDTIINPATVYGISKRAGELWCDYYYRKYQLDVRSLRYPGLISYETPPGGGTTDYAVDIYYKAAAGQHFECFLAPHTRLPMMYMPDAVRATLELMEAPLSNISVHTSYNLHAMSFTPAEVYQAIQKHLPHFQISYNPDPLRQSIADSWTETIDDSVARRDWGWQPRYNLDTMTADMLHHLLPTR